MDQPRWARLASAEEDGGAAAIGHVRDLLRGHRPKYSLDTAACIMTSMFTATNIIEPPGRREQKEKYLPPFYAR